jgi:hypothetical protein
MLAISNPEAEPSTTVFSFVWLQTARNSGSAEEVANILALR